MGCRVFQIAKIGVALSLVIAAAPLAHGRKTAVIVNARDEGRRGRDMFTPESVFMQDVLEWRGFNTTLVRETSRVPITSVLALQAIREAASQARSGDSLLVSLHCHGSSAGSS